MTDTISALVKLRAMMLHMAHEADELAEAGTTRKGRAAALALAARMREAAMSEDMVKASER